MVRASAYLVGAIAVVVLLSVCASLTRGDTIELLSGSKVQGKLVARDQQAITFETKIGEKTYTRKYPLDRVAAITVDGQQREVIHGPGNGGESSGKTAPPGPAAAEQTRTKAQVEVLVKEVGRTPPDWFDATPLKYPPSLDLSFPQPPAKEWNNQRNLGQYAWDIINPNPSKWQEGVKLMHHVLTVNKDRADAQRRAMEQLGHMYYDFFQDYARAAFWWQAASVDRNGGHAGVKMADCYWKLGNKAMAIDLVNKLPPTFDAIKFWANVGDTRKALQLADSYAKGDAADVALVYAGDVCRAAGKNQQAVQYYQRILDLPVVARGKGRIERNQRRARANIEAIKLFDLLDLQRVPDGVYRSASQGYEADVHVEVEVKSGRIESVKVTDHREKQCYASLTDTPRKIIAKQSVKGIDTTTGATITSEAIINATAKALSAAMK